jgi:ADP-ribosylation factor protein 6
MKEALLLVFANKQDIPGAMTPQEVQERLKLSQLKDKIWYVVPSCATTGEGLFEGLVSGYALTEEGSPMNQSNALQGWLSNNVKTPPQKAR